MTRWLAAAKRSAARDNTDKTDKTPATAVKSVLSVKSQPPDPDLARELFEERAAIAEFDGGLTRAEAEALAAQAHGWTPDTPTHSTRKEEA